MDSLSLVRFFDKVARTCFRPEFDLFDSSRLQAGSGRASYCWTRDAAAGDAFLMKEWPQRSYIFPPFPLLNDVVVRLMSQGDLDFILVAPITSRNPPMWLPLLMDLVTVEPVHLGKISDICRLATGKTLQVPGELAAFTRSRSSRRD